MSEFLRITCAVPGFRRAGIAHPAVKTYEPGELTDAQLVMLRAEPLITVEEISPDQMELERAVANLATDSAPALFPQMRINFKTGETIPVDLPTVTQVMRLLLVEPTEALITEISAAVLEALILDRTGTEFRPVADAIFQRHALQVDDEDTQGRSGTALAAPSAGSGPEAEATADASGGVQPAAPPDPAPAEAGASSSSGSREGAADQAEGALPNPASYAPAGEGPEASEVGASGSSNAPAPEKKPAAKKTSTRK